MTDAEFAALANDEALEAVYHNAIAGTAPADRRKYDRYPCTAMVWVAILGDQCPTRDELQLAMCHDVSIDGIAFYFEHIASGRQVVLSLTRGTETLLLASVVSSHAVEAADASPDHSFVIHCEFVGRLSPDAFTGRL